jgi:hypothetical protein
MFKVITESGNGIQGIYKESGKLYRSTTCFIKGVKCQIEETNIGITHYLKKASKAENSKIKS